MKRVLSAVVALVFTAPLAFAQVPPPAQKAKFVPPVKGWATIEVQRAPSKRVGKEIITTIKVKNTSKGSINLLRIDQYWWDKGSKQVSFGDYRHRKAPILPGEIVEIQIAAPDKPTISHDTLIFSHANGKVDAKPVKKVE